MSVSAQVSVYPLGHGDLAPAIEAVWRAFEAHSLHYEPGPVSTLLEGEEGAVFAALRDAFAAASEHGGTVMVVTVSNACPRQHQTQE
jgi:uncharacterized protein YqgV (UPF0045/DUF77 family)